MNGESQKLKNKIYAGEILEVPNIPILTSL